MDTLTAIDTIVTAIEKGEIPAGLPESTKYTFTGSNRTGWVDAGNLRSLVARLTSQSEPKTQREIRDLYANGYISKRGESTATAYTMPRVPAREEQAKIDRDKELRALGARLEAHGLEILYKATGYQQNTDASAISGQVGSLMLRTPLDLLAEMLDR